MQISVLLVKDEGRKSFVIDGWRFKNLHLSVSGNEEELIVRGKGNRRDRVSEIEVSNHDSLCHVDDQGEAVHVDADESLAIG